MMLLRAKTQIFFVDRQDKGRENRESNSGSFLLKKLLNVSVNAKRIDWGKKILLIKSKSQKLIQKWILKWLVSVSTEIWKIWRSCSFFLPIKSRLHTCNQNCLLVLSFSLFPCLFHYSSCHKRRIIINFLTHTHHTNARCHLITQGQIDL